TPTFTRTNTPTVTPTNTPTRTFTNTPTNTITPEPQVTAIVEGVALLEGRTAPPSSRQSVTITLSLRPVGSQFATDYVTRTDVNATFKVTTNSPPGIYDWRIKNAQTLANGGTASFVAGVNHIDMGT